MNISLIILAILAFLIGVFLGLIGLFLGRITTTQAKTKTSPVVPPQSLTMNQKMELRELVQQKKMVQALKLYRTWTGASLKTAKKALEDLDGTLAVVRLQSLTMNQEMELRELVQQGKMIQALKRYRTWTGASLKVAKKALEDLDRTF